MIDEKKKDEEEVPQKETKNESQDTKWPHGGKIYTLQVQSPIMGAVNKKGR